MKVLWFTGKASQKHKSYGGGGWIRSLGKEIAKAADIQLAMSFFYDADIAQYTEDNIVKIPMFRKEQGKIEKLKSNWFPAYRHKYNSFNIDLMQTVIRQYKPDIIQIFGTESMFVPLIGQTDIPVVLYLQGILNPIANSFYPNGLNDMAIKAKVPDIHEWFLNNGIVRRHNDLKELAAREKDVLPHVKYVIGRTPFDYQISRLYGPQSKYFELNEMMRECFYNSEIWTKQSRKVYKVFSTLSGVTYKGFDVILKAAKILKESKCTFEWNIAGLDKHHPIVAKFEKIYGIKSSGVNVRYLGVLSEEELKSHLLDSDVMVHPSYIDNSPNSVCEAQLVGLPVIACYTGGVPHFIEHNKTGLLVPINDPYDIAYYLQKDITTPFMYNYSSVSREVAQKRHSKKDIVQTVCKIYENILKLEGQNVSKYNRKEEL